VAAIETSWRTSTPTLLAELARTVGLQDRHGNRLKKMIEERRSRTSRFMAAALQAVNGDLRGAILRQEMTGPMA